MEPRETKTKAGRRKYYNFYFALPLPELRRRQTINAQQTLLAYHYRNTGAVVRLQRIATILTAVIFDREF